MDRNAHLVIRNREENQEWFEFNGRRSDEFDIRIANELEFVSPQKDVEEIVILGRDGVVLVDNDRREPIRKTIRLELPIYDELAKDDNGDLLHDHILEIKNWLGAKGWHEWRWGMYPGYVWRATIKDTYNIADSMRSRGRGAIQVTFHPVMYLEESMETTVSNGQTLANPTIEVAKPLIKLKGTGNVTLRNNGKDWLILESVDQNIVVDSETMEVYRGVNPQYGKMVQLEPMFPLLYPGNNKITWTGSVTELLIEPRWVVEAT